MDNKTTRLAEIYKSEKSKGGGITSSLGKAALEKLDPRQIFNQKGFLASALPSLFKSYRATKEKKPLSNFISPESGVSSKKIMSKMEEMNSYLKIIAKESINLSKIAIDTSILVERSGLNNENNTNNISIDPSGLGGGRGRAGRIAGRMAPMLMNALRVGAAAMLSPAGIGILAGISAGFLAKVLKEQNDIELQKPENADVPKTGKKAAENMREAVRKTGLIEGTANEIVKRLIEDKLVGDAADKFCNNAAPGSNLETVLSKCDPSLKEKYLAMVAGLNAPTPAPPPAPTTVTGQVFNAQLGTAAGASNAIFAQTGMNPLAVPTLAPTTPSRQSNGKITYLPNTPTTPTPSGSQSEVRAIDNAIIKSQQAPIPPGAVTTESGSVVSTGSGGILTTSPTPASSPTSPTKTPTALDITASTEGGGSYELAFGDKLQKDGTIKNVLGNSKKNFPSLFGKSIMTPEQFSGKPLTEMTLAEVKAFQEYKNSQAENTSALGKYGFMKSALFGQFRIINGKRVWAPGEVEKLGLPMDTIFSKAIQEQIQASMRAMNKTTLEAKGIPATDANLNLANIVGAGGVEKLLKPENADKNALDVLGYARDSAAATTNNRLLNKSSRDVIAETYSKYDAKGMAPGGSSGTVLSSASISVRDSERSSMTQTARPNTIVNNSPTTISNSSTATNQIASVYDSDLFKAISGRAA